MEIKTQYKCKQCKSRLRCIVALAWIVSSDTVCTSLIFSQWGAHLNSASTVPLLHLCLDCLYVRSKITSNARCIALCSMMCALYYALHYAHCAVHMTTASFTPIQSGHSWNPQGHSGTLRNTQEHSGTLRDTHGTLEDNQGHSWNPQGQSGTLLEPSGTFMEPPMTHRDTHGGSRQIGPWVIFPINWALANRAPGKCWCGKLGPSKLGPGKSGPWKMLVHPSNTNVYIGEYMSVEFIYLYYWY